MLLTTGQASVTLSGLQKINKISLEMKRTELKYLSHFATHLFLS